MEILAISGNSGAANLSDVRQAVIYQHATGK